ILLEELGIESREKIVDKLYEAFSNPERYNLYSDVLPALKVLKKKKKKMGIISNWEDWLENRLRDLDITGYFDFIVVSAMVGTEKPDPRIFEIGLEMAGVKPSETVYVGDNPDTDIHPALELGMKAVLLDRKGRFTNTLYHKVSDLNEFAGIFFHQ
ncbi:MAG: HAD-IA family hydrolase, partial [Firmicutes bacterium]|nr:HAD-IA family hydrolase [Bacillota bacterium]